MPNSHFIVGLDLGTRVDFTALSVLEQHTLPGSTLDLLQRKRAGEFDSFYRVGEGSSRTVAVAAVHQFRYDLIHLDRWKGRGYSPVVPALRETFAGLRQRSFDRQREEGDHHVREPSISVLVDHTGVGVAVVEEIRRAGIPCIGITITGGDAINHDGDDYRVPKRELVTRTQVVMETSRLAIPKPPNPDDFPMGPILQQELENFKTKKTALTGHDTYGAGTDWRDRDHDDLVLSVSMGLWWGEHTALEAVESLEMELTLSDYMRRQGAR